MWGFGLALIFFASALWGNIAGRPPQTAHEWIQLGSGLELLFFALALIDKIRIMRDECNGAEQRVRRETAARVRREKAHGQIVREAEELEALSRHKSEFLGIAAHALRDPLSALGITWQMLREEISRPEDQRPAAAECAELLGEAAALAARREARVVILLTA